MSDQIAKKKIFVVSELYYPEDTSTGYFITKIAEGLAKNYHVVAICAKPTYSDRNSKVVRREHHQGVDIRRAWSSRFDKDWMIGRLLNLLTFTITATFLFLRYARKGDVVICLTNPPTLPLFIAICTRIRGSVAILLVHDLYPEVLLATHHLKATDILYRVLYKIFSSTYRLFDRVVVLGRDMRSTVTQKMGRCASPPLIIPNWGDIENIHPAQRSLNPLARTMGLADKTVIQFSGNLGLTHDVETVVRAAEILKAEQDIVFLFGGSGAKAHLIDSASQKSAPPNIRFVPRQPREHLSAMLTCADASIIAFVDEMAGVSVPSRMYNIMAAGVPIVGLCDSASELALTVKEHHCGWVLAPGDVDGLVALVRQIHQDKLASATSETIKRGTNGRRAAVEVFNEGRVVDKFREMIAMLAID